MKKALTLFLALVSLVIFSPPVSAQILRISDAQDFLPGDGESTLVNDIAGLIHQAALPRIFPVALLELRVQLLDDYPLRKLAGNSGFASEGPFPAWRRQPIGFPPEARTESLPNNNSSAPVPDPATIIMLGLGLFVLSAFVKLRGKQHHESSFPRG